MNEDSHERTHSVIHLHEVPRGARVTETGSGGRAPWAGRGRGVRAPVCMTAFTGSVGPSGELTCGCLRDPDTNCRKGVVLGRTHVGTSRGGAPSSDAVSREATGRETKSPRRQRLTSA